MDLIKFFSGKRVYVATIFLSITLFSIIMGGFWLAAFLVTLIFLGSREYVNFVRAKGHKPAYYFILTIDFLLILLSTLRLSGYLNLIISIGVIGSFLVILFRKQSSTIDDVGTTVLGMLYGGWLPMHIILLRNINQQHTSLFGLNVPVGLGYIILIFFVISFSDIFAYYIGKKYGKTPLWPQISPKKTREGAIAGTIGGVVASIVIGTLFKISIYHCIIAGFLLSLAAQYGDLSESMMKRDAGFKDSGNLLPGHGGVLDRADSYIFTGAVAYYYFSIFVVKNVIMIGFLH